MLYYVLFTLKNDTPISFSFSAQYNSYAVGVVVLSDAEMKD